MFINFCIARPKYCFILCTPAVWQLWLNEYVMLYSAHVTCWCHCICRWNAGSRAVASDRSRTRRRRRRRRAASWRRPCASVAGTWTTCAARRPASSACCTSSPARRVRRSATASWRPSAGWTGCGSESTTRSGFSVTSTPWSTGAPTRLRSDSAHPPNSPGTDGTDGTVTADSSDVESVYTKYKLIQHHCCYDLIKFNFTNR